MVMEFCLLGPLVVWRDASEMPIQPGKQRVLLAALLLNANRVMTFEELTETLWETDPPPSARVTLQNYVKRLRRALGDADRNRISTQQRGYMINIDAGEIDVDRFRGLLANAREAGKSGSWARAALDARAALLLWRGEPLTNVNSDLLTLLVTPQFTEMRLEALEVRIDADLHAGQHAAVISELRQLAAAYPLRERLHALLMLALYRDGRQAEALTAYQNARRVLVEELGIEPGPELRHMFQQILTALPAAAAADPGSAAPDNGQQVPRQLPTSIWSFAGRAAELAVLSGLLDRVGDDGPRAPVIVVISGSAGVGKTALAVRWAHDVVERFPDGQLYANLRGFHVTGTPAAPASAILWFLDALGVPADQVPSTPEACEALYRSMLADKRVMVVLDNARDAAQVRPLLPGAGPGCLVMVTSRSKLTSLVAVEGAQPLALDVLSAADARDLLSRRLGAERTQAEPAAVSELIGQCARLPLALAITAAHAAFRPDLPLARLAMHLREASGRLDALDSGEVDTSVRTVFSWSYHSVSGPAARVFRLLGVHRGPDISAPAAASLVGLPMQEAYRLLDELTRAHLLTERSRGRFAFHELLGAYAAERAETEEDASARQAAIGRLLDHYLHTAYAADRQLAPARDPLALGEPSAGVTPEDAGDHAQALAWFQAEHQVLLLAIDLAVKAGLDSYAWQIPWCMVNFLDLEGHWRDGIAVQSSAVAAAGRLGDRAGQARAHRSLSTALFQLGSRDIASAHLQRALQLYEDLGDRVGQARVHLDLALAAEGRGRFRRALRHAEQALGLLQAVDHRAGQGRALNSVGWYRALLGDYEQALACCSQAVRLCREFHDRLGEAAALDSLGYAHRRCGQYPDAVACYQRAVDLTGQIGDRYHRADALVHLGDAYRDAGNPWRARDAWELALAVLDDLNHPDARQVKARLEDTGP